MSIAHPLAPHFEVENSAPSILSTVASAFSGLVKAITLANERRASLEIGRYIERNGGMMTDSIERQIGNRFSNI